jgi:hypothetical protein
MMHGSAERALIFVAFAPSFHASIMHGGMSGVGIYVDGCMGGLVGACAKE